MTLPIGGVIFTKARPTLKSWPNNAVVERKTTTIRIRFTEGPPRRFKLYAELTRWQLTRLVSMMWKSLFLKRMSNFSAETRDPCRVF